MTDSFPRRPVRGTLLALSFLVAGSLPVFAAGGGDPPKTAASKEIVQAAPAKPRDAAAAAVRAATPIDAETEEPLAKERKARPVRYSRKGLELGSKDSPFHAKINIRSELRFSLPFVSAPRREKDFTRADESELELHRARFKMEGRIGKSWIKYKYEHDLLDGRLLDARFTFAKWQWLQVSAGQWKAEYSRERADSSGKQQFADRSIANRAFTVDRQKGVMLHGRVGEGEWWDSQYYAGVFTGNGRGFYHSQFDGRSHDDGGALWVNRYQWNGLGGGVGFSQSDLERTPTPALSLAVASARNRSRYTRFSSSGGGQLDGFEAGQPGQYSIRQELVEAAFKYRGFSTQNEYHWKRVRDNVTGKLVPMQGMVVQAGYFPHEAWTAIPRQLELSVRKAFVDPNTNVRANRQKEIAFVINWFFEGHNNKLTFDTSRYALGQTAGADLHDTQIRTQWEFTF